MIMEDGKLGKVMIPKNGKEKNITKDLSMIVQINISLPHTAT